MSDVVLSVKGVTKSYVDGDSFIEVLKGVSLNVKMGESIAIIGKSGAGKSTLLNLLGGLDRADKGAVEIKGTDLAGASEDALNGLRNSALGFVYQFHHLLPEFTALENVMMPLRISGQTKNDAKNTALEMLEKVGLKQRADHRPNALSGGERQRVAIARALVNEPACVLMDEPTGNLDEVTALEIQALMSELSSSLGTAFVVVTHSKQLASSMDRAVELSQGVLADV